MIDFSGNIIDDETAENVCKIIGDQMKEIHLLNCGLTPQGIEKIAAQISSLPNQVSSPCHK